MSEFEKTGAVPAEAGGTQDAFDMFESGASIEEVNAKFFSSDPEQTSAEDNTDNAEGANGQTDDINTYDSSDDSASGQNDDNVANSSANDSAVRQAADGNSKTDAASVDEKVFSQKDFDSMVGRRIAEERRARDLVKSDYDSLVDNVAKYLGVSGEKAIGALQDELLRREAEGSDVTDVDTYVKLKNAEKKIADMENENRNREQAAQFEAFKSAVTRQVSDLSTVIGEEAIVNASRDNEFNTYVRFFYENEASRNDCVKLAYNAWAHRKGVPMPGSADAAGKGIDSGKVSVPKQSSKRVSENVSSSVSVPDSRLNIDNFESDDFDKIMERVRRGEVINF